MANVIRVMMVDDEAAFLSAWERLVARQPDMTWIGGLNRVADLAGRASELDGVVVLLDLTMPGEDPLATLRALEDRKCGARVIVYSGWSDRRTSLAAADAGAWGLIDKLTGAEDVLEAIRKVAGGATVFASGM